jgi:hypothetical protein
MDLSKLPKLSQSPAPPSDGATSENAAANSPGHSAAPPRAAAPNSYLPPPTTTLAEAWISLAVGALLLLMVPYTLQYASSKVFHTHFAPFLDPNVPPPAKCDFLQFVNTSDGTITRVYYRDTAQFFSDLAVTGFALVLIVDGFVLLLARNRPLVIFAFGLTVLATAGNLYYLVATYSQQGLAMLSALAVAFGVYIAIQQWNLLKSLRYHPT